MFQFHGNINFVTSNWIYQDDRHLDDFYYGLSLLYYNPSLSSGGFFYLSIFTFKCFVNFSGIETSRSFMLTMLKVY